MFLIFFINRNWETKLIELYYDFLKIILFY